MKRICTTVLVIALLTTASALAVGTSYWTHTSEADFKAGKFDNVVATNLGDLKLSRATRALVTQDPRVSAVYALAEGADGAIYAATGPQGVLLRIKDQKSESIATFGDDVNLFSLVNDSQGRLLVGTGGAKGVIHRIDRAGEKPVEIFSDNAAQYVWAMIATRDGNIYAATGPNGKLFEIKPDGTKKIIFEADENNLLSMVSDGADLLYVGTDPNGHIYRVNRKTGESFVVFDAPETEISALALDARGNLYAGTAQSTGEELADVGAPVTEQSGRPEQEQEPRAIPIPSDPPQNPKPPELPLPSPNDPQPIPKPPESDSKNIGTTRPLKLVIGVDQQQPADPTDPIGEPPPPGRSPPEPGIVNATRDAQQAMRGTVSAHKAGQPAAGGNAVYRIDTDGFVTEIFRQSVLVLSINEDKGVLLVGTGGEGMVYQINPSAEETSVVAKVDPKEVLCLLPTRDGRICMGMANDGQVMSMSSGFAERGTFISPVLDATQISRFGKLRMRGSLPQESKLTVATRSGNISETTDGGWSKWSDEVPATQYVAIAAPAARFLQYRLTFISDAGNKTAVVDEVSVAYQMPNVAPQIKSIKISGGPTDAAALSAALSGTDAASAGARAGGANPSVTIGWEAVDPNSDAVSYTLYFHRAGRSASPWVLLKEKLTETTYEWNTRGVGDGRYEVKVVASDAAANPAGEGRSASRISDPIDVDNTAPVIGDLKVENQTTPAKISVRVVDSSSTVAKLEYAIDSGTDWQSVLPVDKMADSPEEAYDFAVGGLSAGAHQVMIRSTDAHGNVAHQSVDVQVGAEVGKAASPVRKSDRNE